MLVHDLFRLSFHNLLLHKIRSFLTSLGIIFGVGSVISMLAISEGAKKKALAQIGAMGIDKIIVYSKEPPTAGSDESDSENKSFVKSYGLVEQDLKHLRQLDNIREIIPLRNARKKILRGVTRLDIIVVSTDQRFLKETRSKIIEGRWLTNVDSDEKAQVCVIGKNVKRKLFLLGKESVIGKGVTAQSGVFNIVGILENNIGTMLPELGSPNDMIIIPQTTSDAMYGRTSTVFEGRDAKNIVVEYDLFMVKVIDLKFIDNTARRIAAYLSKTHEDTKDWGYRVPLDLLKQKEQTQNIFTVVMGSIAGISLIVGGIGIMNIMLANVYERRKEIGTRRALGAKKTDILLQFLIETVFLTSLGGLIGISMGLGISKLVTYYAGWPVYFSMWSIVLSFMISAIVGVVFGTYPAWKAANQNVIEVLRSE